MDVNLATSTIDARSLGLKGVQASGVSTVDIGTGSAATSVALIAADTTNTGSLKTAGYTDFYMRGPGFSDGGGVRVSVNLSGVTDVDTLVGSINTAIENSGNGATASATAFKNAGVTAVVITNSDGTKNLGFTSSGTAFQVEAGDRMANAFMGNLATAGNPAGKALANTVTGGVAAANTGTTFGASGAGTVSVRVQGGGARQRGGYPAHRSLHHHGGSGHHQPGRGSGRQCGPPGSRDHRHHRDGRQRAGLHQLARGVVRSALFPAT